MQVMFKLEEDKEVAKSSGRNYKKSMKESQNLTVMTVIDEDFAYYADGINIVEVEGTWENQDGQKSQEEFSDDPPQDAMVGHKMYSFLDGFCGYNQVRMLW